MFLGDAVREQRKFSVKESWSLRRDVDVISEHVKLLVAPAGSNIYCIHDEANIPKKLKPLVHVSIVLEAPLSSREYIESKKALEHASVASESIKSIHLLRVDQVVNV